MRKKAFTLLELLIAFSLLTLLLGTLFFYFRLLTKPVDHAHFWTLQEEHFARSRLQEVFFSCDRLIFDESNGAVAFTTIRGIDEDPALTGKVAALLFWDETTKTLCYSIWPDPKTGLRTPQKTFVLLDNVILQPKIAFYFPPPEPQKIVDPREVGKTHPHPTWNHLWPKEYTALPALIRITLKRKEELIFYIDLPQSNHKVLCTR